MQPESASRHRRHYYQSVQMLYNLFLAFSVVSVAANAQTLIITHATVIDTVTGKTQPNTTVVIDKNRITQVIASSKANLKSGQVIDAKGQYLIPGLWDMHTHVYFDSTAADGSDLA